MTESFHFKCSSTGDLVFCRLFQAPFYFGVANTKIRREAETGGRTFPKSRAFIFACLSLTRYACNVIPQYYPRAWNRLVLYAVL